MKQYLNVITSSNVRGLISTANAKNIQKEDIVTIKKLGDNEYVLIYYSYYTDEKLE